MSYPSPHDASYMLIIEGPVDPLTGVCDFYSSGPWKSMADAIIRWAAVRDCFQRTNVICYLGDDLSVRVVERGGDGRTWSLDPRTGQFILDPIDQAEKSDPQLRLAGV